MIVEIEGETHEIDNLLNEDKATSCAEIYSANIGKRASQLRAVQVALAEEKLRYTAKGKERVPDVATMRLYKKRHRPKECEVCEKALKN